MMSVVPGRQTLRLPPDPDGLETAAQLLRGGGVVAFPTETVYGLGADALSAAAVQRVFEAKGRPADDPLIVHLASVAQLDQVARAAPAAAETLMTAFWPGPLTLVLPRAVAVPLNVTAGRQTVAVRVPSHPVTQALLRVFDRPLVGPSANLFGRPSPTRAEHVLDDLEGRIDAVLDGGATLVGVESTIVDVTAAEPRLLRPGGLAAEAIEAVLGQPLRPPPARAQPGPQLAPGMLPTHYAPRTPLVLVVGAAEVARARLLAEVQAALDAGQRVGVLALEDDVAALPRGVVAERLGAAWGEPAGSALRLFDAVRRLDRQGLDVLFARQLADPQAGLGRALADRLRRAAARVVGE